MEIARFYPILDTALLVRRCITLEDAAAALLSANAKTVQFRHKGQFKAHMFETAERIAALCRAAGAQFVLNDRADLAMLIEKAGVHVGQTDLAPRDVRSVLGGGRLAGFSTHNEAQLRAAAAEPVDYVALGPIFGTGSKENPDPVVGVGELRRLRPLAGKRPLVAIGGITKDRAAEVYAAGADSIAVIGDLFPEHATPAAVERRAREWLTS